MEKCLVLAWRTIGCAALPPKIPASNAYSQGQGDISTGGEPQAKAWAIRSWFGFQIQDADIADFQPVQQPEFTLVIPHDSHWLGSSLCSIMLSIWASSALPTLVFPMALLRGWVVSILWRGTLRTSSRDSPQDAKEEQSPEPELQLQLFDSKSLCVEPAGVDFSFLSAEGI